MSCFQYNGIKYNTDSVEDINSFKKIYLLNEFGVNENEFELIAQSSTVNTNNQVNTKQPVKVIQSGFSDYGFLSKSDEKKILQEAIKQTNEQGYPVKKGVVYAHWGNMWAVTDKGADAFPVFGKHLKRNDKKTGLGKNLNQIDLPKSNIDHNDGGKGWYDYYPTDQNGDLLNDIPDNVKNIIESITGIDMSVYDSAIINSYGETTELTRHIDNTEDKGFAYKIPIISISLIGDSIFQYSSPSSNPVHSLPDDNKIALKPGQVVVFGNESRAMAHRVLNGKSGNSILIDNSVNSLETERINITLRRALPLTEQEYNAWVTKTKENKSNTVNTNNNNSINSPSNFTNHSGGAYGGDTFWDLIGREFGVTNHKHYKDVGNANLSQQLRNKGIKAEILTKEQMDFAREKVKELLGIDYSIKPNDTEKQILQKNLQVRNFYQVYNSDAVYAVAKINNDNKSVSGGTNTAIQLGIKLNKPVYVWDISSETWNKFEPELEDALTGKTVSEFYEIETPILTKNFAGIGSRDIENYNVQKDGKWQPREEYVGKEKEEKAKQAIKEVYEKTLKSLNTNDNQNVKGEEINSYADDLAFALTNPTHTSPKGYKWKRDWTESQIKWRNYLSKGIEFEGLPYDDVEEAYQKNKEKYPIGEARDNFMLSLLEIKLKTYPELVKGIDKKGGLGYILNSTHQPTKQNSHWESGGDNAFIKLLAQAYQNVNNNQNTQVQILESPEFKKYVEELPEDMQNMIETNPNLLIEHFQKNKC